MPGPIAVEIDEFETEAFDENAIGLALSGGGYKAAAFHLGALIRLNELGWLPRVERIASVSGGSIAAGLLGMRWEAIARAGFSAAAFRAEFCEPLRDFLTEVNLDVPEIALGLLLPFRSGASGVAGGYREHLFGEATLQDLPEPGPGRPEFMILATNYELNSLWRFGRRYAADHRVGMIAAPNFRLADIVAASSAFPPFFCPLELKFGNQQVEPMEGTDRHEGDFLQRALLADGGIYDNMGLEPIWKRCGTLLISNAGDVFDEASSPTDWFSLMRRIVSMIHRQAENNRQRQLMELVGERRRKVAYWPLRNRNHNYPSPSPVIPPAADIKAAQDQKVRLWSLGDKAFARLANHGYALCDSAMRSYLDAATPAPRLPY